MQLLNWRILLLSFALACGLWYMVTVRDRMEMQAEVSLHYRGVPEQLMVRDGMLKSFTVQVRGPRELVQGMNTKMLNYSVDLSHLHRGRNVIALAAPRTLMESRALDVTALVPHQLVLDVESMRESAVPLEPRFSNLALAQALQAERLRVTPASVTLRGPESVIRKIQSLKLDVPLEAVVTGDRQISLPVSTPSQVTASPGEVLVRYSVAGRRALIELERVPFVGTKASPPFQITPRKVVLRVELPEGLRDNKVYLERIRVVIDVKDLPLTGSAEVRPFVELPEGVRLVGISPAKLNVTKDGK